MKFSLVFDNSGDSLPFEVVYNHELFEFFVDKANAEAQNSFSNHQTLYKEVDKKITQLHWAISKTNEVLYSLIKKSFNQHTDLENYLNQNFLNQTHADWVFSQLDSVDIDELRFSTDPEKASIGNRLHDMYPDDIRIVKIAAILAKLGYLYPYEEVNMGVHRLERSFKNENLEFSADGKWNVFENPFVDSLVSNNSSVNFSFAYTYVGRQYYNKFEYFDDDLLCKDHYNYETLEFAFHLNLKKAQTIAYSLEATEWAKKQNVPLITDQIPIANIPNLTKNLFDYRKILYRNSRDNNRARIILN